MSREPAKYTAQEFEILKKIFRGELSRNKNYEMFLDPKMRELHRRALHLRRIKELLHKNRDNYWTHREKDKIVIQLAKPEVNFDAVIFLSREEWELVNDE